MERGIKASAEGLNRAKAALKLKGWTQEYLAGVAGCTRQTISQFLAGRRVEQRIFQDVCAALDLTWGEIAELDRDQPINQSVSLDELVDTVRVNLYDTIQSKCGSMRVLEMSQPIDLDAIYTTVNILEKITGRRRLEIADLLQANASENFERFSLSTVQEKRMPGLEAVEKYPKLMILGKPGAGKTTFLKYVALQCVEGNFKSQLVPLFITLKEFAEAPGQPSLLDYLIQLFQRYGIAPETKIKTGLWTGWLSGNATPTEVLLRQGRILMLLDGLDEVREADSRRVLQQIQDFTNQFAKNPFVITCRIAAREYMFERFVEVEVADFDDQQIATFTKQWFQAKEDPIKAETFIRKLKQERGIRDLAASPILLTLLCLVFGESGSFPANRSELYKEGLDVLLKKWDVKRNIERDQVYQKLSLKRKEDLLSQIALDTFEQGNYFFKQKEVERYISQYICNLPNASSDDEALQLDSDAVLKSIEAQHGLFIERARGIYSFSHLTFHEYFAARKIVTSANADILIQNLASHITKKRWREVFLLAAGMLENADALLQSMQQQIDRILADDEKLQQFLGWVKQKACSVETNYKPAAIRVFYFTFAVTPDREDCDLNHDLDCQLDLDLDYRLDVVLNLESAVKVELVLDRDLDRDFTNVRVFALNPNLALKLKLKLKLDLDRKLDPELQQALQLFKNQLPNPFLQNKQSVSKGWKINGEIWVDELRAILVEYRNIGHDWQFSKAQQILLQQYYDANRLLVSCLNSDCYVSREVREQIEGTLLLPIAKETD
jgi:predicted NACHT family NTPase